jgi:hypothetical protein
MAVRYDVVVLVGASCDRLNSKQCHKRTKARKVKAYRTSRMAGTEAHASNFTMEHLARCFRVPAGAE